MNKWVSRICAGLMGLDSALIGYSPMTREFWVFVAPVLIYFGWIIK